MRVHESIGEISVSEHEANLLQDVLAGSIARTNDPHTKAVLQRLLQRAVDVTDTVAADEAGLTLTQYRCNHEFSCTGTAYGGDDDRWHGEGRCLCIHCGLDGDG